MEKLEKMVPDNDEMKDVIEECTRLIKRDRPSIKEVMMHNFFNEETSFKLEILDKRMTMESDTKVIHFRLRVSEQLRKKRDKPAHKENEAIEFEFNLDTDECNELASNMVSLYLNSRHFHICIIFIKLLLGMFN